MADDNQNTSNGSLRLPKEILANGNRQYRGDTLRLPREVLLNDPLPNTVGVKDLVSMSKEGSSEARPLGETTPLTEINGKFFTSLDNLRPPPAVQKAIQYFFDAGLTAEEVNEQLKSNNISLGIEDGVFTNKVKIGGDDKIYKYGGTDDPHSDGILSSLHEPAISAFATAGEFAAGAIPSLLTGAGPLQAGGSLASAIGKGITVGAAEGAASSVATRLMSYVNAMSLMGKTPMEIFEGASKRFPRWDGEQDLYSTLFGSVIGTASTVSKRNAINKLNMFDRVSEPSIVSLPKQVLDEAKGLSVEESAFVSLFHELTSENAGANREARAAVEQTVKLVRSMKKGLFRDQTLNGLVSLDTLKKSGVAIAEGRPVKKPANIIETIYDYLPRTDGEIRSNGVILNELIDTVAKIEDAPVIPFDTIINGVKNSAGFSDNSFSNVLKSIDDTRGNIEGYENTLSEIAGDLKVALLQDKAKRGEISPPKDLSKLIDHFDAFEKQTNSEIAKNEERIARLYKNKSEDNTEWLTSLGKINEINYRNNELRANVSTARKSLKNQLGEFQAEAFSALSPGDLLRLRGPLLTKATEGRIARLYEQGVQNRTSTDLVVRDLKVAFDNALKNSVEDRAPGSMDKISGLLGTYGDLEQISDSLVRFANRGLGLDDGGHNSFAYTSLTQLQKIAFRFRQPLDSVEDNPYRLASLLLSGEFKNPKEAEPYTKNALSLLKLITEDKKKNFPVGMGTSALREVGAWGGVARQLAMSGAYPDENNAVAEMSPQVVDIPRTISGVPEREGKIINVADIGQAKIIALKRFNSWGIEDPIIRAKILGDLSMGKVSTSYRDMIYYHGER